MFCIAVYILYIYIWVISITHCVLFTWVFQALFSVGFFFVLFFLFGWLYLYWTALSVIQSSLWMKFLPAWLCAWERSERGGERGHAWAGWIHHRCDTNLPIFTFFLFFVLLCVVCVCVWSLGPRVFFFFFSSLQWLLIIQHLVTRVVCPAWDRAHRASVAVITIGLIRSLIDWWLLDWWLIIYHHWSYMSCFIILECVLAVVCWMVACFCTWCCALTGDVHVCT